jgi:plasmid stabilization system protein ParE
VNVRQHAVFYLLRPDEVVVVRILHQSMDISPTLFAEPKADPQ